MLKIENLTKLKLLKKYDSPEIIWRAREELNKLNLKREDILELNNNIYIKNAENDIEYMRYKNIKIVTIKDNEYPYNLKQIYSPPILLYTIGNVELLKRKSIAIVGCRLCSDYGKKVANLIAKELGKNRIVIISGMAKGIDKYAHSGCLEVLGSTIAVLGCGVDYIYPHENGKLYNDIIKQNGLIVSEYPIKTIPQAKNFPERNRIISALSEGVIVVEAKQKSGSLITVECAIEQGKDVYSVPGNINSINSVGTNNLIYEGATPIINMQTINEIVQKLKITK